MRAIRGFTIIELLVVLAIGALLSGIVFWSFVQFRSIEAFNREVRIALTFLEDAHSKTLAAYDDSRYGVHFTEDSVTLFKGVTYDSDDPENEVYSLGGGVTITDISLAGSTSEVVFNRLTGGTSNAGTVTFQNQEGDETQLITISGTGLVEIQ